jgi:hypothetical protein
VTVATDPGVTTVALDRWPELVGTGALLAGSAELAHQVFVSVLRRRVELRSQDAALAYLRRAVLQRSRRVRGPNPPLDLDVLPRKQREALVLRHFSGATDAQAAAAMRCAPTEVEPLVGRALASLDVAADVMTARMEAYAATLEVDRPDVTAAAVDARRQRRRGAARVWVAAVIASALLVAGIVALVQPRGHGEIADGAAGPLPGLRVMRVAGIPAGFRLDDAGTTDGQVWALGYDGGDDNQERLLRGPVGGRLDRFSGTDSAPPGSFTALDVAGGRALLLVDDDTTGTEQTVVTTYDARTGSVISRDALPAGESGAFVAVLGGGVALAVVRPSENGNGVLTVSTVPAGVIGVTRGPFEIPATAWPFGTMAESVSAVRVVGGSPVTAYLSGSVGVLPCVDLTSGVVTQVHLSGDSGDRGSSSGVVGEVGGQVLYESNAGLFAGGPGSSTAARVGDGYSVQAVSVIGDRAFTSAEPNGDTEQQLDPASFTPIGPLVTTRAGQGSVLTLRDGGAAVTVDGDSRGSGGSLDLYTH